MEIKEDVLILVVMDVPLGQYGFISKIKYETVLILVVMDVPLGLNQ